MHEYIILLIYASNEVYTKRFDKMRDTRNIYFEFFCRMNSKHINNNKNVIFCLFYALLKRHQKEDVIFQKDLRVIKIIK